uniref:SLC26A/SulP transporter domain-containing protein n=1 Tax=Triticum urartu TaxID=4572 RepID=A0A8R7Q3U2_TRIUA
MKYKKFFWLSAISPLVSVIWATAVVYTNKSRQAWCEDHPRGTRRSSIKQIQLNDSYIVECAKITIICVVIVLKEAIAVEHSFAVIIGHKPDGNKEMIALGFSNVAGSLSSCYVATSSFSRATLNFSAGARSTVSNIVMAVMVFIVLEFFMKLLYYMPMVVLASIIL